MKATLLAATALEPEVYELLMPSAGLTPVADADHLAEVAGRACYQSWSRPNPATAANAAYLEHIVEVGHESVLAHATATFYVEDVSRSLTHELVRHRFLAFSEVSQRYVDASEFRAVYPPEADEVDRVEIDETMRLGVEAYRKAVERGEGRGLPRKRARQAARAHLPLCTETKIVVSGNHRAWRDFLRQRLSPHADAEIRALALAVLWHLADVAPHTFADAEEWTK